jgi:hypothetical protein
LSGLDCTALKETSGEGKMKRDGNFIRHIEKNIRGINMQVMCVCIKKKKKEGKKIKLKAISKVITIMKRGLRGGEVSCYGLWG